MEAIEQSGAPFGAFQTADQALRAHVQSVASAFGWNMVRSARALDVDRRTLYRWMRSWGIDLKLERARVTVQAAEAVVAP
jgi:transcriptional regulator of acetoin/glycerol metabolism